MVLNFITFSDFIAVIKKGFILIYNSTTLYFMPLVKMKLNKILIILQNANKIDNDLITYCRKKRLNDVMKRTRDRMVSSSMLTCGCTSSRACITCIKCVLATV